MERVALFGGTFSPPHQRHIDMVCALRERFDRVVIVPCGPRKDKHSSDAIEAVHRAAMVDIAFGKIPGVEIDFIDLERNVFRSAFELDAEYRGRGCEVFHAIGGDLVEVSPDKNKLDIRRWVHGLELWRTANFVVFSRGCAPCVRTEDGNFSELLPLHVKVIEMSYNPISSTDIRKAVFNHESIDGYVPLSIAEYIHRHGLYRGIPALGANTIQIANPRLIVVANPNRPDALLAAKVLEPITDPQHADLVIVLGGDGTMMHAVREHWRRRLPFVGINFGTLGFLMNEAREITPDLFCQPITLRHSPLLHVEIEQYDGTVITRHAFNDVYLEAPGAFGWVELKVNGIVRQKKIVAKHYIVSTAAGSGAYAIAAGASPLLVGTPTILFAPGMVRWPIGLRPGNLSIEALIELTDLDLSDHPKKRPLIVGMDGFPEFTNVRAVRVRSSRTGAAEVGLLPGYSFEEKLAGLQFLKD